MRHNTMKATGRTRIFRVAAAITTAVLLLVLQAGMCFADTAEGEQGDYGYTIRIYSGNQGTFADGSTKTEIPAKAGESVTLDAESLNITVTNSKYYLKGIRPAGYDSNDTTVIKTRTLTVGEDQAYVAVYGVKGNTVKYTVHYVDANGQQLLPPAQYYGAAGDKPVVSYRYIDGYQPTAYNETKTLTDNEADNVFTFRYRAVAAGTQSAAGTTGTAGTTGAAGTAGTGNAAGAGDGAGNAAGADANAQPADQQQEPAEIVDLDTEEVPLADNPGDDETDSEEVEDGASPLSKGAIAGIAAGSLGILGLILYLLVRRKAKDAE